MSQAPTRTGQLVAWLDDAYAMENGLLGILQSHAAHFTDDIPDVAQRLRHHVIETQQHAQRVEECLRLLDARPSATKSTLSSLMGSAEGGMTALFRDQLVKNALADYASEQFEVACYSALVSAATQLGYPEVARLCRENLEEDQAMARWMLEQLPLVVSHDITPSSDGRRPPS